MNNVYLLYIQCDHGQERALCACVSTDIGNRIGSMMKHEDRSIVDYRLEKIDLVGE